MAAPSGESDSAVLPAAVRARVVALAAAALNSTSEPEVPAALRAIRRFTPAKQTRLGGTALAVALENDPEFRARVGDHVERAEAELVGALKAGMAPAAGPLVEMAAIAYILRSPGWQEVVARADSEATYAAAASGADELEALRADLMRQRADSRTETSRLRSDLADARSELDDLRRRLRTTESALGRATTELQAARAEAVRATSAADDAAALAARDAEAEQRRLRSRLNEAEVALSAARRSSREAKGVDSIRLRVLLDTVLAATTGLRRELDLPLVVERPADTVSRAVDSGGEPVADPFAAIFAARGQLPNDPSLVDAVLAVPGLHLLVDGYNVTKAGFPEQTLEAQRHRLLTGLGALASRNPGVEITCVFDGTAATVRPTAVPTPRGVRVLFSAVGELADDLLVRLVRSEPEGRPVAIVTNDREIVTAAGAAGARALSSQALLARLDRA
jgi:predicted RNA-binding protein with PIN domain